MRKIVEFIGRDLTWVRPELWKREYELRSQDEVVAALRFKSPFSSQASGESGEGSWIFKRIGFLQTTIAILEEGTNIELGRFKRNWKGIRTLMLPYGRKYLASAHPWQSSYIFSTEAGEPLIHYKIGSAVLQSAATLIEPRAANIPELPWMVLLGWYVVVRLRQRAAAAGASR